MRSTPLKGRVRNKGTRQVRKGSTVFSLVWLTLLACTVSLLAQPSSPQSPASPPDPEKLFEQGEVALKNNQLDQAEHDFRGVLSLNPKVAGAYANLGVVYMRRKQWSGALEMLHKAEDLAPGVVGIRL